MIFVDDKLIVILVYILIFLFWNKCYGIYKVEGLCNRGWLWRGEVEGVLVDGEGERWRGFWLINDRIIYIVDIFF